MEKFFLKSKTIIGIASGLFVSLAPMVNISFTADDAHFIGEVWDKVAITASALFAAYGRFKSSGPIKIL